MKHEPIQDAWEKCSDIHAEGVKLHAEVRRLSDRIDAIRAAGNNLYREAAIVKYGPGVVINWVTGEIETSD
jgi:hypothetical protein